jgi:hypothetical protein
MAITFVPDSPLHIQLESFDTGNKAAARHTAQIVRNISFLQGKNVETITHSAPHSCSLVQDLTVTPATYDTTYEVFYWKSPGVKFALFGIEPYPVEDLFSPQRYDTQVEFQLPTGVIYPTRADEEELNTVFPSRMFRDGHAAQMNFGVVDVSKLTNAVTTFAITASAVRNTISSANFFDGGLKKLEMFELPSSLLEVGTAAGFNSGSVDAVWSTPYRTIVEGVRDDSGGITAGYGFKRVVDQTQQVQTRWRNCWQIVNHQGSAAADGLVNVWSLDNTGFINPLDFKVPGVDSGEVEFWIRTRNYFGSVGTTQTNRYVLHVRHRGAAAFLDFLFESEPSGITGTPFFFLPASATWRTTTLTVDLPCDQWDLQREQLVRFWFTGNTDGSGFTYISTLALIENEP